MEPCLELPGPLSATVPLCTIVALKKKFSSTMLKSASKDKINGPYLYLMDEQKYSVGKRASESDVANTL